MSSSAVESAEPGNGALQPPSCLARIHEDLCRVEQILDASREMRRRAGPESRSGVDPEGPTEQALAEIWQNLLGVRDIGRSDDFFGLGGTSVVAVSLLSEVERTFGRDLTLEHLVDTSDLAGLARLIENPGPSGVDVASVLVPLQPLGSKTPYFAVHGAYGHVLGFVHLARALGADQPFYGLQPAGLVPGRPVDRSVPRMAEHYLDAIRQVQPRGPYRLLGKCFGSLVALEIAQRLEDAGETVEFLGLVDPPCASRNSWATLTRIRAGYYYEHYLRQPLQRPLRAVTRGPLELVEILVGRVRHGGGLHRARMRRAAESRHRPAGRTASPGGCEAPSRTGQRRRKTLVFEANLLAQQAYHAEAYAGRVALILAGRAPRTYDVAGWGALVQDGVQVRVVPGHKRDIMSPAKARSLAECVRAAAQAPDPRVCSPPGRIRLFVDLFAAFRGHAARCLAGIGRGP